MKKRSKRKIIVLNSASGSQLLELGQAHFTALLLLSHIAPPKEGQPYLDKAIAVLSKTMLEIEAQLKSQSGQCFSKQDVIDAFRGPDEEAKSIAV